MAARDPVIDQLLDEERGRLSPSEMADLAWLVHERIAECEAAWEDRSAAK